MIDEEMRELIEQEAAGFILITADQRICFGKDPTQRPTARSPQGLRPFQK